VRVGKAGAASDRREYQEQSKIRNPRNENKKVKKEDPQKNE